MFLTGTSFNYIKSLSEEAERLLPQDGNCGRKFTRFLERVCPEGKFHMRLSMSLQTSLLEKAVSIDVLNTSFKSWAEFDGLPVKTGAQIVTSAEMILTSKIKVDGSLEYKRAEIKNINEICKLILWVSSPNAKGEIQKQIDNWFFEELESNSTLQFNDFVFHKNKLLTEASINNSFHEVSHLCLQLEPFEK